MSEKPATLETTLETTPEVNLFAAPTQRDRKMLEIIRPIGHQLYHAVRFILEQQAQENGSDLEVTAEDVVYYAMTSLALIGVECQDIENADFSRIMERVNRQSVNITEEHSFPIPIGNA